MTDRNPLLRCRGGTALAAIAFAFSCAAGSPSMAIADPVAAPATPTDRAGASGRGQEPLAPLTWLAGCWRGSVNQREFREHWMPLLGGMMIGTSHTVIGATTQSYEYLRLETRVDGNYYVAAASGQPDTAFRLSGQVKDQDDDVFTFVNTANAFPQRIVYRRGAGGWLYAHVEGTVNGADKRVIYPMRRVDCDSGEAREK
jgi:hypothetical protein